jgi:hypothetical protein
VGESWLGSRCTFEVLGNGGSGGGVEGDGSRNKRAGGIGRTADPDRVASGSFGAAEKKGGKSDRLEHYRFVRIGGLKILDC